MKNLKKIAALVIVLAMALSSVAFAFTDVAEDAGYYEAVEVMSALGLLKGYEDGTFGPDKTITRAEFAAVVVRALGMEDAAAGAVANTMFTDVTSSHWAAGYVQIANQQGIIAGYGDGIFGPEDEVTYEQAVKMIVCALGYGVKFAGVENAYPSAYLSQANTSGITVGAAGKIGEKATRATVAKLVYNALDVKLMEQTGFGSEEKFEEVDKTLLSSKLNIIKVEATVETLFFNPEQADEVTIDVTKANDIYVEAVDADVDDDTYAELDGTYEYAEGVELQKGYNCVAYIDVADDDYVIKAMVPKAGKNATLVLTGVQTKDSASALTEVEKDKFELKELKYFKNNADVDTTATKIKLNDVKIYVNKDADESSMTDAEFVAAWNAGDFEEITLIDNGNDNKYDYIYVTDYRAFVVTEIKENRNRIDGETLSGTDRVILDPEDEENTFEIKDVNGNELAFADIKVGDVLNIFVSTDDDDKTLTEVIVSNETVEGTITEYNSVTGKYTIGDAEYAAADEFAVGDAGKFTVDMYGNIVGYSIDASNRKFGMIYTIYLDESGVDEVATALILTADGKFESYTFAKKVDFNGTEKTRAEMIDEEDDILALGAYTLNSSNEITKLYTAANIEDLDEDYSFSAEATDEYDAAAEEINKLYVADSSIILTVKTDDYTTTDRTINYAAASKSYFVDEEEYTLEAIVEDDEIIIAMLFGAKAKVDATSIAMYVTSVSDTTDSNGDDAKRVKGYVDGELVTVVIPEDVDFADGDAIADIKVGSMIQYLGDAEATAVDVLVAADDIATADGVLAGDADDDKEGYFAFAGKVEKVAKNKFYFGEDGEDGIFTFDAGLPAMFVRLDDGKIAKVFGNELAAGDVEVYDEVDGFSDDFIIIYKYDGEAIGAIIVDVDGNTKI